MGKQEMGKGFEEGYTDDEESIDEEVEEGSICQG
jgi:hypothetical protein